MKKILTVLILGICFMITGCKDKHPVLENRMINGQLLVYNANRNKPYSGGYSVTEYKNNVSVVTEKGYYKKGLKNGTCYSYTNSGVLFYEFTYKNGHKLGYKRYYYNSDIIDEIVKFNNLETYRESYYTNRQLKSKGTYYDRKEPNTFEYEAKIGAYEEYYENGQLKVKETYNKNNQKIGAFEEYYENGQLKVKGTFNEKGQPTGTFEIYYENGQLNAKGTFNEKGQPTGTFEEYYENGQLKIKETYNEKGEQLEFLEYSENGVLKK